MAEDGLVQILALLVLDTDGGRLAVKYNSYARKELWPTVKQQVAFEKRVINKLPKPSATRSDVDVAVIDDYTVIFQACNDVVVAAVAASSENELVMLELAEGMYNALSNACQSQSFLSSGLTKQLVLDSLSDVLFILDEVTDNGVIMETDDEKISARIKMIDETEVTQSAQAEQMFQKATQSAKQKLLGSLMGSRGDLMRPQERSKDASADGTAAVIPEFIDPDEAVVSGWFADYKSTSDDGGGDAMSWLAAVASRPHRSERLGVGASPPAKEDRAKEMQPLGKAARKAISRRLRREQEEAEYAAKDANAVIHAAPDPFAAMLEQDVDITLKVIVVGNGQVGKTSMITRFAKGIFTNEYKKTIGVDFLEKRTFLKDVGEEVTYLLWDTAGQEEYDAITRAYYKGAGACILAFSTTDRDSFDAIESWYKKVHDECGNLVMVLVQNKVDLLDEAVVEAKEVETIAKKLRLKLYRTCVKDDLNVSEVFTHLGNEFVKNGGEASVGRAGMMSIEEVASKPMAERSAAAKAGGAAPAEDAAGDQPFKLSNGKPSVQRTGRLALEKFGGVKGASSVEPPEERGGRSSSAAPRNAAAASRGAVGSRGGEGCPYQRSEMVTFRSSNAALTQQHRRTSIC
ncbi:RAB23 [Symbiodinium sp. CCMP2456]|nr:RAB23 [Symbiodinium sp. CCMP2456]